MSADDNHEPTSHTHGTPRSRASAAIENFSNLWFTVSMNTGILSILMHQNPYQFDGLYVISTILFVFNIGLFILISAVFILRLAMFPSKVWHVLRSDVTELAMLGAIPIAYFTIVAQVGLTVSQASWGRHGFTIVAYVMWWIGTAAMLLIAGFVQVMLFKYDVTNRQSVSPALVIPFVGTATNAVVGALIVTYSYNVSGRLAVPVIVFSYMLIGVGLFDALIVFALVVGRLADNKLPPTLTPSLFLLVGPPGQCAAAIVLLGTAAQIHFPQYNKGTTLTASGGSTFGSAGVLLGLMFVGLASYFAGIALYMVLEVGWKRQHQYSLMWWGTLFPVATVNTAWIALATSMDSPTFRTLSSIFLIALTLDYLGNWAFTLYHIFSGRLLNGPRSPQDDKEA